MNDLITAAKQRRIAEITLQHLRRRQRELKAIEETIGAELLDQVYIEIADLYTWTIQVPGHSPIIVESIVDNHLLDFVVVKKMWFRRPIRLVFENFADALMAADLGDKNGSA